jgi:secretion/DNA translocation related TadE-like protein
MSRRSASADGAGQLDRGSATLWVLAACVAVCVAGAAAALWLDVVTARHRAEAAADLAALAAATAIGTQPQPCPAAGRVAEANHARLISCRVRAGPDGRSGVVGVVVAVRTAGWSGLGAGLLPAEVVASAAAERASP